MNATFNNIIGISIKLFVEVFKENPVEVSYVFNNNLKAKT